jgi:hypothetical protein
MIDLVRASALPTALVQSMAKGAVALPPREIVEILVYLAKHNPVVREQARQTLENWNPAQLRTIVADPSAPREVVEYFRSTAKQPVPSVSTTAREENRIAAKLEEKAPQLNFQEIEIAEETETATESPASEAEPEEFVVEAGNDSWSAEDEAGLVAYLKEHEEELNKEGQQPFQPLGGLFEEELVPEAEPKAMAAVAGAEGSGIQPTSSSTGAHEKSSQAKKGAAPEQERGSVLQKISRLDIKGRIQLALKGTKEERSILIRDSAKLVCLAVLESPKITDGEVEKFASQKNVLEAVLRQIPMKRRFAKNYIIVRNLVFNPRTPLDLSLGLMKNLLVTDLKNLSSNKEVSDTIRKLGLKMYKQKLNPGKS